MVAQCGMSLSPSPEIGRRDVLAGAVAAACVTGSLEPSNAYCSLYSSSNVIGNSDAGIGIQEANIHTIQSMVNPPPILNPTSLGIPRVGYSFYKTPKEMVERCAAIALRSGVTHLDLATQYQSNAEIGKAIRTYLKDGRKKLALEENTELLELMDASFRYQASRTQSKSKKRGSEQRREELFISHKLSNEEQSTNPENIQRAVFETMDTLGVDYLDMVSIHSPLTNSETRLATYQALVNLQEIKRKSSPIIRSIGVCNYGLGPLKEIKSAGLPLPAVNQLELSPFNGHRDVVEWCDRNGVAVSCAAWSRLSGKFGPSEQWNTLSRIADQKGVTKAQLLVRWSLQKGYICLPRSGIGSTAERLAIVENSYGGGVVIKNGKLTTTSDSVAEESAILTPEEMKILDQLDVKYKAGKLGRTDGWNESDIKGANWDPTEVA